MEFDVIERQQQNAAYKTWGLLALPLTTHDPLTRLQFDFETSGTRFLAFFIA
jgi:hypothetical protein